MRRTLALGAAGAAAAVLLAGCGSSSSSSSSVATAAATPTQSSAASTTTATGPRTTVATEHGKLGTILVAGPSKRTVYLFEADKGSSSTCDGECAQAWPPVTTTKGSATAAGSASTADLGTTMRADGSEQVTYKGHPLYFFEEDTKAGDAKGEGSEAFGAGWYVMTANGNKVDNDDDSGGKDSGDDS